MIMLAQYLFRFPNINFEHKIIVEESHCLLMLPVSTVNVETLISSHLPPTSFKLIIPDMVRKKRECAVMKSSFRCFHYLS